MVNEEEEFEEFDESNEITDIEEDTPKFQAPEERLETIEPKPSNKKGRPPKTKVLLEEVEPKVKAKPEPQYVGVPRAVPIETMINEIYDGQQEIKQVLMVILEKLNIK
jgi:hypothetical protein